MEVRFHCAILYQIHLRNASARKMPLEMLPLLPVSSSSGQCPIGDWNWIMDIDSRTNDRRQKTKDWAGRRLAFNSHHPLSSVFCPLSLNSFAFAAWSFGVLESLRPRSSSKDYALCATGAELTRPLRCPAAQAAARTKAAGSSRR